MHKQIIFNHFNNKFFLNKTMFTCISKVRSRTTVMRITKKKFKTLKKYPYVLSQI